VVLLTVTSVASARRHRRVGSGQGLLVAVGVFTLLATACGVRQSTGVASIGTPSSTTTAAPSSPAGTKPTTYYSDAVDFARCMRAHGDPGFPDPTVSGGNVGIRGLDPKSPQFQTAETACRSLSPGS
jgi:hypothetical protein